MSITCKFSACTCSFHTVKCGFFHVAKSMLNTHILYQHFLFISCKLVGFTNNSSESRRLACFSRSVYKIPKSNRSFIRLLLGNCLCKSQRRGSTLSLFSWLRSHYYLSNLALNQGQRCSPSWPIITIAMLSYFKWKGGVEGCRGYLAHYPSPPKMPQANRCV